MTPYSVDVRWLYPEVGNVEREDLVFVGDDIWGHDLPIPDEHGGGIFKDGTQHEAKMRAYTAINSDGELESRDHHLIISLLNDTPQAISEMIIKYQFSVKENEEHYQRLVYRTAEFVEQVYASDDLDEAGINQLIQNHAFGEELDASEMEFSIAEQHFPEDLEE